MTIKDCIDIVDNLKPNQYTIRDKVMWLSFIEEIIINEVLKTHEGYDGRYDNFEGYTEDKLFVTLIVGSPYDRLYTAFLTMKIDETNGETQRYNNSKTLYNTYMSEYRKYYNRTHMPISAIGKRDIMPPKKTSVGLSDAEYENIKKDLTNTLTEMLYSMTSDDKLRDIVNRFVQDNIQMLKGKDGRDGVDGKDGYTPQKNIDYFDGKPGAAFKYSDFTPEQLENLRGPEGKKGKKGDQGERGPQGNDGGKGDKGEDGYTPIKGIDYFTEDDIASILNRLLISSAPTKAYVNILGGAENWVAEEVKNTDGNVVGYRYGQVVNVNNAVITPNSKVDLQITSQQMVIFHEKDLAFVAEQEDGVVTIYCIGQIPEHNYRLQATVTEVETNA